LPFLKPGARVLDVGSNSGYLTAVLYHLVSDGHQSGKVVGIDHIPQLVDWSVQNLKKDGLQPALDQKNIEMVVGDGRQGYQSGGPYDAIHVGAAAPTMPSALIEQLAKPGKMFIPVGTHSQFIWQVTKDANGNVSQQKVMGVVYVPLTDPPRAEGENAC
jgi:protein-L-isoaspartate(D-aspartate) O-methyltransferase